MNLTELPKQGLVKFLVGATVAPEKLSIHITEVAPGSRSHAAHTHAGVEAFYVFEGQATVEVEGEHYVLHANEAMVIDATVPHGIFNSSTTHTRYMVIIAK